MQQKILSIVLISSYIWLGLCFKVIDAKTELPNVVLFITDDQDIVLNGMVSVMLTCLLY